MIFAFLQRRRCPACGSPDGATLADTPFDGPVIGPVIGGYYGIDPTTLAGGRYVVTECRACATIYQAQVGGTELLTTLYDVWLNQAQHDEGQSALAWLAAHPRQSRDGHEVMTAAALLHADVRGLKTLDFGMGKGLWAGIAKDLGCQSHGFDLSSQRMNEAAARGIATVGLDQIAGGEFDFINTEQVMEHVTDVRPVMEMLAKGLRPGGLLKISVPAQGEVRKVLAQIRLGKVVAADDLIPVFPLEHVNAFSVDGIVRLGRDLGLERVRPGLVDRFRFIWNPKNWMSRRVANTIKELVRPFVPYENPSNLTIWLRKAKASGAAPQGAADLGRQAADRA